MKRIITTLALLLSVAGMQVSSAAMKPKDLIELEKQASQIVLGKITKVTAKVVKSKTKAEVETPSEERKDIVYSLTVEVKRVKKGDRIEKGNKIEVLVWKKHTSKPKTSDPKPDEPTIRVGKPAVFYLKDTGLYLAKPEDKKFVLLPPNGLLLVRG